MPSDPFNTKQINLSGKPILREKIPLAIHLYSIKFYIFLSFVVDNRKELSYYNSRLFLGL